MSFTNIPTEQTTAATDVVLAALAFVASLTLHHTSHKHDPKKSRIWEWAFGLLAIAAFFGAIAHGFKMTDRMNFILWQPINFTLGLTMALIATGVTYDLKESHLPRTIMLVFLAAGIIFYTITLFVSGSFIVFILYEAMVMLFALISYIALSIRKKRNGYSLMALGITVSIIAAGCQTIHSIGFRIFWEFDNNGLFHLIQMPGILLLLSGLRKGIVVSQIPERSSR
jgi:hypothetical protein